MAVGARLVSLFTLSSIALLFCSLHVPPVAALSVEHHPARALHNPAHDALAKRKRSTNGKRCKPRPAPAAAPTVASPAPASSSPVAHVPGTAALAPSSASSPKHSPAAPAPSPSPQGGGPFGGSSKAGLGWPNDNQSLDKWKGIVSVIYTWSPSCPSGAKDLGITCCPMLWGWKFVSQWQSEVMNTNPACVMGPNEPEIAGQSNMSPSSGLQLWNTYVRPMKARGAKLISPATTSDPAGKKWMIDFFQQCGSDCDVDLVACHWYDIHGDALIAYLNDLHATYKKDLWLSEFACQNFNGGPQCTMDQVRAFQAQVTAFMNQANFIQLFGPFGAMHQMQGVNTDNSLMNPDGSPNDLALAYYSGH